MWFLQARCGLLFTIINHNHNHKYTSMWFYPKDKMLMHGSALSTMVKGYKHPHQFRHVSHWANIPFLQFDFYRNDWLWNLLALTNAKGAFPSGNTGGYGSCVLWFLECIRSGWEAGRMPWLPVAEWTKQARKAEGFVHSWWPEDFLQLKNATKT